jgi:hypothetical protein
MDCEIEARPIIPDKIEGFGNGNSNDDDDCMRACGWTLMVCGCGKVMLPRSRKMVSM